MGVKLTGGGCELRVGVPVKKNKKTPTHTYSHTHTLSLFLFGTSLRCEEAVGITLPGSRGHHVSILSQHKETEKRTYCQHNFNNDFHFLKNDDAKWEETASFGVYSFEMIERWLFTSLR